MSTVDRMRISDFSKREIKGFLRNSLFLYTGPFVVSIKSSSPLFLDSFYTIYHNYFFSIEPVFVDYSINLSRSIFFRRFFHPQVDFLLEHNSVFQPLPYKQIFPTFEWGVNWAIGNQCNHLLVVHAGVVEKNGVGIMFPGTPGAGKSTLCAALMLRGWRLLSDELALIDLNTVECIPLVRPISLKAHSIEKIRNYSDNAVLTDTIHDTQKGSVAYLKVSDLSLSKVNDVVKLAHVVFPEFSKEIKSTSNQLNLVPKTMAFMKVADQSFNFHILGNTAFHALTRLLDNCNCYDFSYNGNLDAAVSRFNDLANNHSE